MTRLGFFRQHLNGDHSLVQTSLFNLLAINLHVIVLGALPTIVFIIQNPVIRQQFYVAWLVAVFGVLLPWQLIGLARACWFDWYRIQNYGGVIMAVIVSIFSTFLLFYYVMPKDGGFGLAVDIGLSRDLYTADISVDGSKLTLSGGLHYGTASKVKQLVHDKGITHVQLEVSAGHLYEARQLAQLVRDKNLDVSVTRVCLTPCTLILASGKNRTVSEDARIGFQSYKMLFPDRRSSWFVSQNTDRDTRWLQSMGVDLAFIYQSFYLQTAVPFWRPSKELLLSKNWIDAIDYTTTAE